MVPMQSVMVLIWLVMVHLARRGFQDCVVYCLLPPTLVCFAVLQPGLFLSYCLIHCTTTRTTFSQLHKALCWSVIVYSATRAVISLLLNILWCHSLLALDILFPCVITMTKFAFLFWILLLMNYCPLTLIALSELDLVKRKEWHDLG